MDKELLEQISKISLSMFRKDFFGIFHGSISARMDTNKFLINTKDAIFDDINEDNLIYLTHNKDYRWNEASIDSDIHSSIYQNISHAKFIAYTMPPFAMSYMLENEYVVPKDYFGSRRFKDIKIYDPKGFDDWYERADTQIMRLMSETKKDLVCIRGYGIYAHARELKELAKKVALVENSCKILIRSK